MRRASIALAALLLAFPAAAQTQFPANTLWGNTAVATGLPTTVPVPSCSSGLLNYTPGSGFGCIGTPSAALVINVDHAAGVNVAGCGSGTGTAACKNIWFAYYEASSRIVHNGPNTTANINSDCNFTETFPQNIYGMALVSGGVISINGNIAAPASCSWTTDGIVFGDGAQISINGFWLKSANTGKTLLYIDKAGLIAYSNMIFGPAVGGTLIGASGPVTVVWDGGTLAFDQPGDACLPNCFNYAWIFQAGAALRFQQGASQPQIPAALAFNQWLILNNANAAFGSTTFAGAGLAGSTGQKYQISNNSMIPNLNGIITLPGNISGQQLSGSCVDNVCSSTTWLSGSSGGGALVQNTTGFFCQSAITTSENVANQCLAPTSGTFKNFRIQAITTPAAGQTWTATLRINNASTGITCQITSAGPTCVDTLHTAAIAAGQVWDLQVVASATVGSGWFAYGIQMDTP